MWTPLDSQNLNQACSRIGSSTKEENMNNEIIIAIVIAVAIVATVITAAKFPKIRHAFLVPEGYAGLLYHKVPLKNGKAGSPAPNTEESGAS